MATLRTATASGKNPRLGLVRQPGGTIRFNKDGSTEATETFSAVYEKALQLAPVRNVTPHPTFASLICNDCVVTEREAGLAEVVVTYIGDATGEVGVVGTSRLPQPTYELISEAREEPIESYPNFSTTIGTTGNGAKYDSNNLFLGFDSTSEFVSMQSWLVPGLVWRKSYVQKTRPSAGTLTAVGRIDSPDGPVPSIAPPRNWLLRSFTYTLEGNVYRCQKEWLLSSRRGWNATIYTF